MRRFFLPPDSFADGCAIITGDLFHHMTKVLRMKAGSRIIIADGEGKEFVGIIERTGKEEAFVTLLEMSGARPPSGPRITLYQGLPKGDRMEFILQKTTELGVAEIVPYNAGRSVARVHRGDQTGKVDRWQRIVREAARQSGCSSIPEVSLGGSLTEIVKSSRHTVKLLLWEEEKSNRLKPFLAGIEKVPESVALIVGPEGGLTAEEVALATDGGFMPVSLGQRILRTETAGMAMLAILQFYWGDLG